MEDKFKILSETNKYVLGHIYEETFLIDKVSNVKFQIGSMYGDPSCGLIDEDNNWCIVGGSTIIIWTPKETTQLNVEELHSVCQIRQITPSSVQILIDPWSDNSSIWELDVFKRTYIKIRDFLNYKDKEYTEIINW